MTRGGPSKLPFRLDNSMPRESQLLNEALVRKRGIEEGRRVSGYPSRWGLSCISPLWILYHTRISFQCDGSYFKICRQSGFLSLQGCFAHWSEPLKFERRQVLPLIIETGKLAHSKVSQSSWGNDPFSSQAELFAFQKIQGEEHLFIGVDYWEFYINLVSIVAQK